MDVWPNTSTSRSKAPQPTSRRVEPAATCSRTPVGSNSSASEAAALEADWLAGRWMLDRPAWELTAGKVARWTGRTVPRVGDRTLFSAVADEIWRVGHESIQANPTQILIAGGVENFLPPAAK